MARSEDRQARGEPALSALTETAEQEEERIETQVESYRQAREARRTELVEDYVELIADLLDEQGEARQVDLANRLGVKQPTVAKMLKRLSEEGLVTQRPYRGVFLTDEGRVLAEMSRRRHQIGQRQSGAGNHPRPRKRARPPTGQFTPAYGPPVSSGASEQSGE